MDGNTNFENSGKGGGFEKGEEEFSLSSAVSIREVTYQVNRNQTISSFDHWKLLKPI